MPRTRRQIQFLTGTSSSSRSVAIATYFGSAAALVPAVLSFASSLREGSLLPALAWGALLVALAGWFFRSLLQHVYVPLPQATRFQPFVKPDELNAWPRDYDVARVRAALDSSASKTPIVVGPSGAGKTTILRNLLPEALGRESITSHYIDDYTTFLEFFPTLLVKLAQESTGSNYREVVILDQFEQLLAKLRLLSPQDRDVIAESLTVAIRNAMQSGVFVVISVRFEWFYDLRILGDLVPAPSECIHVEGPRPADQSDQTLARILSELRGALQGDEPIIDEIIRELGERGSLLLLETQVVGSTLESLRLEGTRLSLNYLVEEIGGINGAIDLYFDDILAAAPNRRVALKVLAALSTATRFRRQEDISDVYDVVF